MNDKEIMEEADRLLLKDEIVKNVAAVMHGSALYGAAVVSKALLPHLETKYSVEDVGKIGYKICDVMKNETLNAKDTSIADIIKIIKVNLKFLENLEEVEYE